MANVVIIGGGLTGLAAAWELERQHIPYTLIEVKKRFGGSIVTEKRDGFTLDGSAFLLEKNGDWDFLSELGLEDALIAYGRYRDGELVYFRAGTQTLVDALAAKLTAPIMRRMAVLSAKVSRARCTACHNACGSASWNIKPVTPSSTVSFSPPVAWTMGRLP